MRQRAGARRGILPEPPQRGARRRDAPDRSAATAPATSSSSPRSTSTSARSAGRSRRRSSPSRTTPASSRVRCRFRTSSSRWGLVLDGVAPHMADYDDDVAFRSGRSRADRHRRGSAQVWRRSAAVLPAGRLRARPSSTTLKPALTRASAWSIACPVFLASDPEWAQKFRDAGLPIVGDDIKSQVGATIVHRSLARLFADRGVSARPDLSAQHRRQHRLPQHAGAQAAQVEEDFQDRIRPVAARRAARRRGHPHRPVRLHSRGSTTTRSLSSAWRGAASATRRWRSSSGCRCEDSSNSAGVVIDALRCAKLGLDRGVGGPLEAPSAYYMKSPPRQFRDSVARDACNAFIDGEPFELPEAARKREGAAQAS